MKNIFKARLHHRVIATSIATTLLFSCALAWVINQLYNQSSLSAYSSDLLSQVPVVVAQLKRDKLLDMDINEIANSKSDYLSFICKEGKELYWVSSEEQRHQFRNVCPLIPKNLNEPALINIQDQQYVVHQISPKEQQHDKYRLLVLRNIDRHITKLNALKGKTLLYITALFATATALLYAASHWSFSPVRLLTKELDEITESKRTTLGEGYPRELEDVAEALNRMIKLRETQKDRYRHAMDDLAHSLKSRLAATNALLDDNTLSREELNNRVIEQVSQMDDMVQYQLKRALVGQRGLVREEAFVEDPTSSLTRMLAKVFNDKPVYVSLDVSTVPSLPVNKSDLIELLGNILENAYRFCINEVLISTSESTHSYFLRIEDDGPGVPEQYRETIFQRGVRADELNPGTGIGLAVCHEIVQSYGGNIKVTRSSLEGAAFVIELPKHG